MRWKVRKGFPEEVTLEPTSEGCIGDKQAGRWGKGQSAYCLPWWEEVWFLLELERRWMWLVGRNRG